VQAAAASKSALRTTTRWTIVPLQPSCPISSLAKSSLGWWPRSLTGAPSSRDLCRRMGTTNLNQSYCIRARLQSYRKSLIKQRASALEGRNEAHCIQILPRLY
jgi:hypothetical protein